MNDPILPEDDDLEHRVSRLEQERAELLSMTKEVIRLSQIQTFNTQQVTAMVGRVEVGVGTVLERLDHVEQSQSKHADLLGEIKTTQASHSERFDKLERRQDEHSIRFDGVEKTQEEHGEMMREILARLPEKGA